MGKEIFNRSLVQQRSAQNPQHFVCTPVQLKVMLYNSYHAIGDDSRKYLDSYGTFTCLPKGLNFQVLLDPFKRLMESSP